LQGYAAIRSLPSRVKQACAVNVIRSCAETRQEQLRWCEDVRASACWRLHGRIRPLRLSFWVYGCSFSAYCDVLFEDPQFFGTSKKGYTLLICGDRPWLSPKVKHEPQHLTAVIFAQSPSAAMQYAEHLPAFSCELPMPMAFSCT